MPTCERCWRNSRPAGWEQCQECMDRDPAALRTENARLRERVAALEVETHQLRTERTALSAQLIDACRNAGALNERAAVVAWLREAVMGDAAAAIEAGEHHNRCKNCGGPKQSWQVYCGAACCAEAERG